MSSKSSRGIRGSKDGGVRVGAFGGGYRDGWIS